MRATQLVARIALCAISASLLAAEPAVPRKNQQAAVKSPTTSHYIVESFPDRIAHSRRALTQELNNAAATITSLPQYVIVPLSRRWPHGRTVRVAFRGGNDDLYKKIADAANDWITIGRANVLLRFRDSSGRFYKWSPTDLAYAGEIRVAFATGKESGGYWSHVGADSADSRVEGGSPGQASMNLEAFNVELPTDWRSTVLHEFGHALGFEHEHQNPTGGCDFRFADDPGYVKTTDADGWYTTDRNSKRPGLYTYLGGKANYWDASKVDDNLRTLETTSAFDVGAFDKLSIMKYFFNDDMFVNGRNSQCYTDHGQNDSLSAQDIIGVRRAYPSSAIEVGMLTNNTALVFSELRDSPRASTRVQSSAAEKLRALR